MSKLNIDQKTIKELFSDKKTDFLIPDYQRPYAWDEDECVTLWEDIFAFAIPDNDYTKFNSGSDEYFLGPIVTFKNKDGKMEIIDGQQRLTTLMLLLRAFHFRYGNKVGDEDSIKTRENLEQCIWKTDEFDKPNKNKLKIDSEVATDNDKEEFLAILSTGQTTPDQKSNYAKNYRLFQKFIDRFSEDFPGYFSYLPTRILNNCILLPIEAESQDTALRIFSTLNDRGMPLSDSDIFKAQLYGYYSNKGEKASFIEKWKNLEELCVEVFHSESGNSMNELFTEYMYFERAKQNIKSSTTEALRKFYEKDKYSLLKQDATFENLRNLALFWSDVNRQDTSRFSNEVLRRLFVLNYAPNGMWTYFVSVYYMSNKDEKDKLDDIKFLNFLNKITAFIWTYAFTNPGVNALRTPVYSEMVNIVNNKEVEFNDFKFDLSLIKDTMKIYQFTNGRPITKSMLAWWAFSKNEQDLLSLESTFEIEHIYAKNRQGKENSLINQDNLEALGNKSLLEKRINIRASDYRFADKKKYYSGYIDSRTDIAKKGTEIFELKSELSKKNDFTESDIRNRNDKMLSKFIEYLKENKLIKEN